MRGTTMKMRLVLRGVTLLALLASILSLTGCKFFSS